MSREFTIDLHDHADNGQRFATHLVNGTIDDAIEAAKFHLGQHLDQNTSIHVANVQLAGRPKARIITKSRGHDGDYYAVVRG